MNISCISREDAEVTCSAPARQNSSVEKQEQIYTLTRNGPALCEPFSNIQRELLLTMVVIDDAGMPQVVCPPFWKVRVV